MGIFYDFDISMTRQPLTGFCICRNHETLHRGSADIGSKFARKEYTEVEEIYPLEAMGEIHHP